MFARYFFAKLLIGLIASTVVLFTFIYDDFEKFELVTLDQRFKARPARPVDENIVLIEMAEDSIEAIGRWPWERQWHAALLNALHEFGARVILFDVIFDKPSQPTQDLVFREAIKKAGNVYLPHVFEFNTGDMPLKDEPSGNVRNVLYPLPAFREVSAGSGHVNVAPDIDGTLRSTPVFIEHRGRLHPQVAYRLACDYLGKSVYEMKLPLDKNRQMLVSWAGRWEDTFKHYSYIDIITSYNQYRSMSAEESVIARSAEGATKQSRMPSQIALSPDIVSQAPRNDDGVDSRLRGNDNGRATSNDGLLVDLTQLKGKICIIGLTASGLYDIRPIPLEASYPVVGMNANIINNILKRDFITRAPKIMDAILIYLMGILVAMLVSKVRFIRGGVYTVLALCGYVAAAFLVFIVFGKWITIVYPALSMIGSFFTVTLYNEVMLALERKKYFDLSIRDGLTKLFNIRHFKEILDREFALSHGKRRARKLSLIMADVDYFKNFNDTYGHQIGDFVLKRVAKMFRDSSRAHDVAARYGGEEFIMMLPGTDMDDAKAIAERVRETIEKTPFKRYNETYSVTVSLGVATLKNEKTKEEFIKKVDDALYAAKKSGRNRVCYK